VTVTYYGYLDWPLGRLLLISDGEALTGLWFVDGRRPVEPDVRWDHEEDARPFSTVRQQLREYSEGHRRQFDVPLRLEGTPYQQRVWSAILEVPFGQTITYRELARRAGSSAAARAAGLATGQNPISIIVACHRIVGSDGSLTGYGGGLDRKRALLAFESGAAPDLATACEAEPLPLFGAGVTASPRRAASGRELRRSSSN
jgi:methylated-DNA-[protein]-cysteine S-methyltransferase